MWWPVTRGSYVGSPLLLGLLLILLRLTDFVAAQTNNATCISLKNSRMCQNFSSASISTNLTTDFPFLQFVSSVDQFDSLFATYITQDYAKKKYQQVLQCDGINLSNTTYLYARFSRTVLCAQMIQESITPCGLNANTAPPVCASTCADFATSEEQIVMTPEFCGGTSAALTDSRISLIRADFTVCALPANSLSSSCIQGLENEPDNCGFGTNLVQLCTYCGRTSPNATSFCCLSSDLSGCSRINIPPTRPLPPIFTSTVTAGPTGTSTSSSSSTPVAGGSSNGLSTGTIIGIAIAAALVGLIVAALVLFLCFRRRRRDPPERPLRPKTSTVPMSCGPFPERNGYEHIEDDSRVRRMAALHGPGELMSSPEVTPPRISERGRRIDNSSSSDNNALSSPEGGSPVMIGTLPPPPPRGGGSYGSGPVTPTRGESALIGAAAAAVMGSRGGNGNGGKRGSRTSTTLSTLSPGTETGSEAASVSVVADHYSTNAIVAQSEVVALWSYTPRLQDEMALERGDVVRIENLYDDGWALGRKLKMKVWDLPDDRSTTRDSGIGTSQRESSSTAHRLSSDSPSGEPPSTSRSDKGKEKESPEAGSIKAFPMVCVCHRDAWAEVTISSTVADNQVVAREEEESTSPTPELGGRRISPTRYDLGMHGLESSSRKETRFGDEPLSSSGESPESRGRGRAPGGIQSRSSSQGSRFQEHGV